MEENFSFEGFEPPILDTEPSSLRAQEILSSPFTFSFLEDWDYSPNMSVCTSGFDSINSNVEQSPESCAVVETFDIEEENLERSVGCCCS